MKKTEQNEECNVPSQLPSPLKKTLSHLYHHCPQTHQATNSMFSGIYRAQNSFLSRIRRSEGRSDQGPRYEAFSTTSSRCCQIRLTLISTNISSTTRLSDFYAVVMSMSRPEARAALSHASFSRSSTPSVSHHAAYEFCIARAISSHEPNMYASGLAQSASSGSKRRYMKL